MHNSLKYLLGIISILIIFTASIFFIFSFYPVLIPDAIPVEEELVVRASYREKYIPWWPNENDFIKISLHSQLFDFFPNNNMNDWKTEHETTTLITIFTPESLIPFKELVKRWKGPISAIFYLKQQVANYNLMFYKLSLMDTNLSLDHIRIHIVIGDDFKFPFNHLRNLAWNIVKTQNIILWDNYYLPSVSLYDDILTYTLNEDIKNNDVYIIPSFDTHCYKNIPTVTIDSDYISANIFNNELEHYSEISRTKDSIFFKSSPRYETLLKWCLIHQPEFFNSPLDYKKYYYNARHNINNNNIEIEHENIYWGYTPIIFGPTSMKRPDNRFANPIDSISQHFINLLDNGFHISGLPYPFYSFILKPNNLLENNPDLYVDNQTLLCDYSNENENIKLDFMCSYNSVFTEHLYCCDAEYFLANHQEIIETEIPNWNKILSTT